MSAMKYGKLDTPKIELTKEGRETLKNARRGGKTSIVKRIAKYLKDHERPYKAGIRG